jgi:hypothetical protein
MRMSNRWITRGLDITMAALFVLAVVVQFNDPDPARWIFIYGVAAALSIAAAARLQVPPLVYAAAAAAAAVWAGAIVLGGPAPTAYGHMMDQWKMASQPAEEAREASGLVIVAAWMTVLYARRRVSRRAHSVRS